MYQVTDHLAYASATVTVRVRLLTALVAEPAVLRAVPGLQPSVGPLTARLTSHGVPVAGRAVAMVVGTQPVCSAVTNGDGVATCDAGIAGLLATILQLGFDARFAGDTVYAPSNAHAPITRVGSLSVR
jgi:hypothetical protein